MPLDNHNEDEHAAALPCIPRHSASQERKEQPNDKWSWVTADIQRVLPDVGPTAFCLATLLAGEANLQSGPNRHGLALGEALLGDGSEWNITGHEFRGARMRLERRGYASFRLTEHGWVGRLNDGRLFRIFPDSYYDDQGNLAVR